MTGPAKSHDLLEAFRRVAQDLMVARRELGLLFSGDGAGREDLVLLESIEALVRKVRSLLAARIPDAAREKEVAGLRERVRILEAIRTSGPRRQDRLRAERELAVARAQLGAWMAGGVLRLEDLSALDGEELGALIRRAERDIGARRDLGRVVAGVELALKVALYAAGAAGRLVH